MEKAEFYMLMDIDGPSDFKYFENLEALFEEETDIDTVLMSELINDLDKEALTEMMEVFFDKYLEEIPDNYSDFYITVETIKRVMCGGIAVDMTDEDCREYADLIDKFRHWYSIDTLAYDVLKERDFSVKAARYEMLLAKLTDEPCKFDFRDALNFDAGGYTVRVADMIENSQEFDEEDSKASE